MPQKLFLIDGHALVFKMYYAFLRRPMINSKGADMSILFGFTKYLLELVEREKPSHLAVAFDPPGGTFRNELYPEYKGTRPPTPQLIIDALEPLTALVRAMNVPVLMIPGFEADDVLGSVCAQHAGPQLDVYMVTPDKDYGQLIGEHAFQYKPGKSGADAEVWGTDELCSKWGISKPSEVIDMLAICGDTADNVPGVKGVGEVGAAKLIAKYGTLENIYAHLEELTPRLQAQFLEAQPHMALSKTLVTIKTDMQLPVTPEEMRYTGVFSPELVQLFDYYEFASLKKYLRNVSDGKDLSSASLRDPVRANAPERPFPPETSGPSVMADQNVMADPIGHLFNFQEAPFSEVLAAAKSSGAIGLITEAYGEGIFAPVKRVLLGTPGQAGSDVLVCSVIPGSDRESLRAVLEDAGIAKYGADLKWQSSVLAHEGIGLAGPWNDVRLMHYVLNPERSHELSALAQTYLDVSLEEESAAATGSLFDENPEPSRLKEAAVLVPLGLRLRQELPPFYDQMEEPLAKVLAKMERDGVKVDLGVIRHFADGLRRELSEREARIREMADEPSLNISSPKQVGELLFDKLHLDPKAKKSGSKGQYSTDEATLLAIADRHPIVDEILEFRAVKKLLSTYIEPFPSYISEVDGRVHTTFNQALTATGRLSSSNPNLQNIPIRTERGKEIRKAFVPGSPEGVIVSADYSQIELRIMAHLSGDEHLTQAFRDGVDVHAATAAKIFGIPVSEVTREQRGMAKTANFGIMYGISSFGLAQRLHLPRGAAKALIDDYFAAFPSIRSFIDASVAFAREHGYVQTLFGRRRYLPDIQARNATVRALAERNAVNAPIQGTSADIIKLAMIGVARRLREEGFKSRMVLQIHDELVFDALPSEVPALKAMVKDVMENVISLAVPLTVECSAGKNWLEAH
ncbi:MAG: DNA polymerase I [Bacteroidales bacterium]|nr:DNA polymerase I [Bacteroidales bacterium]